MAFIAGTNAAVSGLAASVGANAFAVTVEQSTAEALKFGDRTPEVQGFVLRASATISGFLLSGSLGGAFTGMLASGSAFTGTFKTGNTVAGTLVQVTVSQSTALEQFAGITINGRFSGAIVETWA